MSVEHEAGLAAFVMPQCRQRYTEHFESKNGRKKLIARFAHSRDWDPAYVVEIRASTAEAIVAALTTRGAPPDCWVTSALSKLDQRQVPLRDAIAEVFGSQQGTVVSCIPARLAYYEGEDALLACSRRDSIAVARAQVGLPSVGRRPLEGIDEPELLPTLAQQMRLRR